MLGDNCSARTIPYIENKNLSSSCSHEATTSKINDEQLFYHRFGSKIIYRQYYMNRIRDRE